MKCVFFLNLLVFVISFPRTEKFEKELKKKIHKIESHAIPFNREYALDACNILEFELIHEAISLSVSFRSVINGKPFEQFVFFF